MEDLIIKLRYWSLIIIMSVVFMGFVGCIVAIDSHANSKHSFEDSEPVGFNIDRFENDEVICYAKFNGISCIKK